MTGPVGYDADTDRRLEGAKDCKVTLQLGMNDTAGFRSEDNRGTRPGS
ncbi:hypothetical protein ABZ490_17075 [Streptomyces sp. NPDC005811]